MKHTDILERAREKFVRFCVYVFFFLFSGFHSMVNNWNNDNMLLFNIGIWCLLFVVCELCFYSCEGYAHWMSLSLNDTVEITLNVGLLTNLEINTYKKIKRAQITRKKNHWNVIPLKLQTKTIVHLLCAQNNNSDSFSNGLLKANNIERCKVEKRIKNIERIN